MPSKFFGAAAEFVAKKYGGPVEDLAAVESIGIVQTEVLRNNPERVFVLFVNLSVNTMYVGYDEAVGSTRGILLAPNGGSYQADVEEDFTIPVHAHHVVSTGVLSNLYVLTVRRIRTLEAEAE